jgi:hypothetical protein
MKRSLGLGLLLVALPLLAGCGGDDSPVSPEIRARKFTFAPEVAPKDREWIQAALDQARPEAASLIDDVDGMVTVRTAAAPTEKWAGLTEQRGEAIYDITLNIAYLNGRRKQDRNVVVLHEFGHVIDFAITPPELRDELAASLPPVGSCVLATHGDCTEPQERFADTFAKWALRGAVSLAGAGYGVASPASLEDWGAPLATLAISIEVSASR